MRCRFRREFLNSSISTMVRSRKMRNQAENTQMSAGKAGNERNGDSRLNANGIQKMADIRTTC